MEARFSAPVQTGPVAHPAFCTMGTGSFPGVKRPGRGANHPPPSEVLRSWKGRVVPLLTIWASVTCIGRTFTFTFSFINTSNYKAPPATITREYNALEKTGSNVVVAYFMVLHQQLRWHHSQNIQNPNRGLPGDLPEKKEWRYSIDQNVRRDPQDEEFWRSFTITHPVRLHNADVRNWIKGPTNKRTQATSSALSTVTEMGPCET